MSQEAFMALALEEAAAALAHGDVPVGAVVARGGSVIARAHNERELQRDPSAHAEVLAMRQAAQALGDWRLPGCTLYVTLEPCPMCAALARQARLSLIVFGASDPALGACGSRYDLPADPAFGPPMPTLGGVLSAEAAALLQRGIRPVAPPEAPA